MSLLDLQTNIVKVIGIVVVCLAIIMLVYSLKYCCQCGSLSDGCCPCPNDEWADKVQEWSGNDACCWYTWVEMCEEYQEAHNVTFDCFE